ncbi:hypothetical protein [Streptosporangium sp. NPDC049078]|uniref:hypothetical protein n=1 Tax=Streptosporangium sp. NPDC049078 TaxID=3155767 RepID=UPI0034322BCF
MAMMRIPLIRPFDVSGTSTPTSFPPARASSPGAPFTSVADSRPPSPAMLNDPTR